MPQYWSLDTEEKRKNFMAHVANLVLAGNPPTVQFVEKVASDAQKNAMWLWGEQCASFLNDCGLDQRVVLREDMPIPWTKTAFIDQIWRKVEAALTGKTSTRDMGKMEVSDIVETITRHIAQSQGVTLPPFPSKATTDVYR
jgi:hypothetical protein